MLELDGATENSIFSKLIKVFKKTLSVVAKEVETQLEQTEKALCGESFSSSYSSVSRTKAQIVDSI